MPSQPFFPKREGDQIPFFVNLQLKIANYYGDLDISAPRQAKLTLVLSWLIWTWQTYLPVRRSDSQAATNWRNLLAHGQSDANTNTAPPTPAVPAPPDGTPFFGMLTWLFEEIARWKKAEGYTETIGTDLGIIGAAGVAHNAPPVLIEGTVALNSVGLDFNLYEHGGVWIESQVQGEPGFSFLATDTNPGYTDNRPVKNPGQAEWRTYRACWWDNSTPTMVFGPVLKVLVTG